MTIHAFTVREPCRKSYANVLRSMRKLPSHFHDLLNTWIATPKGPVPADYLYFGDYSVVDGYFKQTV